MINMWFKNIHQPELINISMSVRQLSGRKDPETLLS